MIHVLFHFRHIYFSLLKPISTTSSYPGDLVVLVKVPAIMRRLKYPVEVNRSKLQAQRIKLLGVPAVFCSRLKTRSMENIENAVVQRCISS